MGEKSHHYYVVFMFCKRPTRAEYRLKCEARKRAEKAQRDIFYADSFMIRQKRRREQPAPVFLTFLTIDGKQRRNFLVYFRPAQACAQIS